MFHRGTKPNLRITPLAQTVTASTVIEAYLVGRNIAAFAVGESTQGFSGVGVDLNGDGDTLDRVLHVLHPQTGRTRNLRLALHRYQLANDRVAFSVLESGQGLDLNGDGDIADNILHVFDARTGQTTNLGMEGAQYDVGGDVVALLVSESVAKENMDLNNDGDQADYVLHIFECSVGLPASNVGRNSNFHKAFSRQPFAGSARLSLSTLCSPVI